MLLDSKRRMTDSQFTTAGRYLLLCGADPTFFEPRSLANPFFDQSDMQIGATSAQAMRVQTTTDVRDDTNSLGGPLCGASRTWARIVSVDGVENDGFSRNWAPLSELEDFRAGLVDLVRSIVDGTYNDRTAPWEYGALVTESGARVRVNDQYGELRHVWRGFPKSDPVDAAEIVRPYILAQCEFSGLVNGLGLPPVVRRGDGSEVPIRRSAASALDTDRLTSKTIRNRLVANSTPFLELDVGVDDVRVGVERALRWVPIERRRVQVRIPASPSDTVYEIELARKLDVIRYDRNLYFIGKIVPVAMRGRPEVTTAAFLRIFTVVFEDGT